MSSEFIYNLAEKAEQNARDDGIENARIALSGSGSDECIDCGEDIPADRKCALPSANRCIVCQNNFEKFERT